jgi:hypothetical protein
MTSSFVPQYYQRDLRLKLQCLTQGSKSVKEYYQEHIIGLACCNIHEDKCSRFLGGLCHDIHDILDYKDWTRFPQLYHLALKAEREVQRRQNLRFTPLSRTS